MSLTPETRKENFLARIAGDPGKVLEPLDREEWFLQRIIDGGDGKGFQPKITATGILKGDGNGNVSAATDSDLPRPGDPYAGVNLAEKFAAEIAASGGDEWAWIKSRIQAGNFSGIHVADYIPFTTTNNITMNAVVAGINTYKDYSDVRVGNHIDFITREMWPDTKMYNPVSWNNGLIPVETVSADGTATTFVLTKEMNGVDTIKSGDTTLTGWTYDADTFTITFEEAPAAGTLTVTGVGSEHPWLASDLYLWLNSLVGQVPNSTDAPPDTAVKHVDYTADGVFYYLPQSLKNVIVEKRFHLEKRYSSSGKLTNSNGAGWANIGKLWIPTEVELCVASVWTGGGYAACGSVCQYPIFANGYSNFTGDRKNIWILSTKSDSSQNFVFLPSRRNIYFAGAASSYSVPICFRIA